jgi:hypothetical protein
VETLCSACQYPNRSGELFCSHCGKRLLEENRIERTGDPNPEVPILVVGLLFAGAIILVFVLAVRFQDGSNSEAGTAPPQTTTTPAAAATPPTQHPNNGRPDWQVGQAPGHYSGESSVLVNCNTEYGYTIHQDGTLTCDTKPVDVRVVP